MHHISGYIEYDRFYNSTDQNVLDTEDWAFEVVHSSPAIQVNINDCFLHSIFKELFGTDWETAKFRDGNKYNWDIKPAMRHYYY